MTFQSAVWAVDGNTVAGALARLMLQGSTMGSQGTIGHLDCIVNATTPTPTAGIVINPGMVLIAGNEAPYQGSYFGWNIGNDTSLSIAATTGAARSDMIVARAEDPTWSGSPWGGPASGQIVYPRVISGVSSTATAAPAGISAIALARIDMPASTSVVQQSYIHDLRQVAIPQTNQVMLFSAGSALNYSTSSLTATVQWPAGATWPIAVPAWATSMVIFWSLNEVQYVSGTVRLYVWPVIGSSITAPTVSTTQVLCSLTTTTGPGSHTIGGGWQGAIPASIRGTTQTLQFAQKTDGTNNGTLRAAEYSSVSCLVQFQQLAALA